MPKDADRQGTFLFVEAILHEQIVTPSFKGIKNSIRLHLELAHREQVFEYFDFLFDFIIEYDAYMDFIAGLINLG